MRRILLVLSAALVMAAMMVVTAAPAFADHRKCTEYTDPETGSTIISCPVDTATRIDESYIDPLLSEAAGTPIVADYQGVLVEGGGQHQILRETYTNPETGETATVRSALTRRDDSNSITNPDNTETTTGTVTLTGLNYKPIEPGGGPASAGKGTLEYTQTIQLLPIELIDEQGNTIVVYGVHYTIDENGNLALLNPVLDYQATETSTPNLRHSIPFYEELGKELGDNTPTEVEQPNQGKGSQEPPAPKK